MCDTLLRQVQKVLFGWIHSKISLKISRKNSLKQTQKNVIIEKKKSLQVPESDDCKPVLLPACCMSLASGWLDRPLLVSVPL